MLRYQKSSCVCVFWFVFGSALAQTWAQPLPSSSAPAAPDPKADALARFDRGVKLFDAGSLDVALTEFLEARRLYPLRSATANAVVCLDQLGRDDEALEMAEALVRDFGATMSEDARARAQRKLLDLRARVGTIEITKAEVGATIVIDGKDRGQYPPLGALRVKAGSHLLRVIMAGFEPFETQVDVAGGGIAVVETPQKALTLSGRLSVVEQSNKTLDVVLDGVPVGKTPWQGTLTLGDHVVLLRGDGPWGTLPTPVVITKNQTTRLSLVAEELTAQLRIEPSPANAAIALDGIILGRGVWEGALRTGEHRIEVTAADFLPTSQSVRVGKDERKKLRIVLQRNPQSVFAVQKPHFMIDGLVSVLASPAFGGDVGRGVGVGGLAMANVGYELASRFAFGISLGGIIVNQLTEARPIAATPVELISTPTVQNVLVNDDIMLRGLLAGGWAGYTFGGKTLQLQLRLSGGAALGSASDSRSAGPYLDGAWQMCDDGKDQRCRATTESHPVRAAYVATEIRFGWKISPRVALGAGVSVMGLYSPTPPMWDEPGTHVVVLEDPVGQSHYGLFRAPNLPAERFLSTLEIVILPGLGLRYDF